MRRPTGVNLAGNPLDAVDEVARQVVRLTHREVGQAHEQLPEQGRELHARQVAAQAEVRTTATEADVRVGGAGDVEALRVVERRLVLVARPVEQRHLVAGPDLLAADLGVDARGAPERHHRTGPAHELLGGRADAPLEVVEQQRLLLGVLLQREDGVRRGLVRGVVARYAQQHEERRDLLLGELLAVDLRLDERGDQVVARIGPPRFHQRERHRVQRHQRVEEDAHRVAVADELGVVPGDHRVGGGRDRVAVGLVDPDHLRDRPDREPRGDLLHEIDLAEWRDRVDDRPRLVADLLLDLRHPPRGEHRADQLALLDVPRRVHREDGVGGLQHVLGDVLEHDAAELLTRREHLRVAADRRDVGVACQRPETWVLGVGQQVRLGRAVPGDRPVPAQLGEHRVTLGRWFRPERQRGDVEGVVVVGSSHRRSPTTRSSRPSALSWST